MGKVQHFILRCLALGRRKRGPYGGRRKRGPYNDRKRDLHNENGYNGIETPLTEEKKDERTGDTTTLY
jgi:hypothetical protein